MMEYTRLHCELDFLESKKFGLLFEKEVNDLLGVNHFSLHLMLSPSKIINLTSCYSFVDHYCKSFLTFRMDNSLSNSYYNSIPFYAWEDVCPESTIFKKQQYNFNSGMNLIRELGDYNLIYSIASFDPNPDLHFKMVTQINLILEAGDFLFNMFHDYFSQKSNINLPKIEKFTPYLFGLDSLKQKNLCLRGNNECY